MEERVPRFTDWLHEQLLTAIRTAGETAATDAANDYANFEDTIDRLESRGYQEALLTIWNKWQEFRYEND